jgi:DNA-binding response OmpR family regulator
MDTALSVDILTVRLADEGVPLRAIARATHISSSDLRELLLDAQADGRLLALPHDDWPAGFPRDQRSLQISRLVTENRQAVNLMIKQLFGLRPGESQAFVKLVEHEHVSREVLHTSLARTSDPASDIKLVDVSICRMRKQLAPFAIVIETIWGYGYCLNADNRRRAMDLILQRVAAVPAL